MSSKYTGGCLCGAIRYESDAEPIFQGNCHCRDCQRTSGGAYVPAMLFPENAVRIHGEPKYFESLADSGGRAKRGFCPTCGSQLFASFENVPGALGVRAGTLDEPSRFSPRLDIYVSSAASWDTMNAELPKHARGPSR